MWSFHLKTIHSNEIKFIDISNIRMTNFFFFFAFLTIQLSIIILRNCGWFSPLSNHHISFTNSYASKCLQFIDWSPFICSSTFLPFLCKQLDMMFFLWLVFVFLYLNNCMFRDKRIWNLCQFQYLYFPCCARSL